MLGSPSLTAIWSPNWEKVPGSASNHEWDFRLQFQGLPLIIPDTKMQLWLFLTFTMLFVSPRESQNFARPQGVGQTSRGSRISKPALLSKAPPDLLCLQAGMESGQYPGRSEAGQRPALLLLKSEQDFLHFNFPNRRHWVKLEHRAGFLWKRMLFRHQRKQEMCL